MKLQVLNLSGNKITHNLQFAKNFLKTTIVICEDCKYNQKLIEPEFDKMPQLQKSHNDKDGLELLKPIGAHFRPLKIHTMDEE